MMKRSPGFVLIFFVLGLSCQKSFSQACDSVFDLLPDQPVLIWNNTLIPTEQAACIGERSALRDIKAGRFIYHVYGFIEQYAPAVYCRLTSNGFSIDQHPADIVSSKVDSFVNGYNRVVLRHFEEKLGAKEFNRIFISETCRINPSDMARKLVDKWSSNPPYHFSFVDESTVLVTFDKNKLFENGNEFTSKARFTFTDMKKTPAQVVIDNHTNDPDILKLSVALSGKSYLVAVIEFTEIPEKYRECFCDELKTKKHRYVIPAKK